MRDFLFNFHTFVVGFVAAEFLGAWRDLLRDAQAKPRWSDIRAQLDLLQLFWSILLFLLLIQNWWSAWIDSDDVTKNFVTFALSLFSPVMFSITQALLFRKEQPLEKLTSHRWRWFYASTAILIAGFILLELLTNLTAGRQFSLDLIKTRANAIRLTAAVVIGLAAFLQLKTPSPSTPIAGRLRRLCATVRGLYPIVALLICYILLVFFIAFVPDRFTGPKPPEIGDVKGDKSGT